MSASAVIEARGMPDRRPSIEIALFSAPRQEMCDMPVELKTLLTHALDDEYKAKATFAAVIDRFSPVRPFINIVDAERRHNRGDQGSIQTIGLGHSTQSLGRQGRAAADGACETAVRAEVDNIALYDRLLPEIAEPGVHQTLSNLQRASRDNHLPAFWRCLSRETR
jgi:hypothetical protein